MPESTQPAAQQTPLSDDPVVIVGMACHLPGDVHSPEDLWELVLAERDVIGPVPTDRNWDLDKIYDPEGRAGTLYLREGGFLPDAAMFDADFFGIGPRNAAGTHPQQRLLLQTAWEALERSRIDPTSLKSSVTGVFVGAFHQDYGLRVGEWEPSAEGLDEPPSLTGGLTSGISGRFSFFLDLKGPSITVDTACSSSLTAVHLTAESLRAGECSLALAGGVTVLAEPGYLVDFCRHGGLAHDGRTKAFSADADGFGPGEGVGVLVMARASHARRLGAPVLAILRGSAVNQDGTSNVFSAPHGPAQESVIRQTLASCGLASSDVDLIEAHGTGTRVGDPTEATALLNTYGQGRSADRPIYLGSVKSNIGHALAAAGVAGIIKSVMAVRHGVMPRSLHLDQPSTAVDWSSGHLRLLTERRPWPTVNRPRRAGVLSYGVTGSNAHAIIEQVPDSADGGEHRPGGEHSLPWVLSGRTPQALKGQAERLLDRLRENPDAHPSDVGLSLATTRARFVHRGITMGKDSNTLIGGLRAIANGDPAPQAVSAQALSSPKTVFVFPGQGSQWPQMAVGLLKDSPAFAARARECADALDPHTGWSLLEVLKGEPGAPSLDRDEIVQPVLFAMLVCLAGLWRDHGVIPDAVVGHSQGEIAAACVAGALSLNDAARLIALRAKALPSLAGRGGMLALALPARAVPRRIEPWGQRLSLAVINGPTSTVVSGDTAALEELAAGCERDGVWARSIAVDYASHSSHVEDVREQFVHDLAFLTAQPATIPFYSTVTAALAAGPDGEDTPLDADYWYRNLRQTVRFEDTVRLLLADGHQTFIEISPHPVLRTGTQETIEDTGAHAAVLATLRRDEGGHDGMLTALAAAHVHGVEVDWTPLFTGARQIDLPTYAFQRDRYWINARAGGTTDLASAGLADGEHPILTSQIEVAASDSLLLTGRLSHRTHSWIADHTVKGTVLLPGTAFLDMALHAAARLDCDQVEELILEMPLALSAKREVTVQVSVGEPDHHGRRDLAIHSRTDEADWVRNATGTVSLSTDEVADDAGLSHWPPVGAKAVEVSGLYSTAAALGYAYGSSFRNVRAAWRCGSDIFAEITLDADAARDARDFGIHPALFDSALHPWLIVDDEEPDDADATTQQMRLPFAWRGVKLHATGATNLRVRLALNGTRSMAVHLADHSGAPVLEAAELALRPISSERLRRATRTVGTEALWRLDWKIGSPVVAPPVGGHGTWALIDTDDAVHRALTAAGLSTRTYPDLTVLAAQVVAGTPLPSTVVISYAAEAPTALKLSQVSSSVVRHALHRALEVVQQWLGEQAFASSKLVVLTREAVALRAGQDVHDPVHAPVWGLIRTAQTENPGQFVLIDTDGSDASCAALPQAIASGEPEQALRNGQSHLPRFAPITSSEALRIPVDTHAWRLDTGVSGSLEDLTLLASPESEAPLQRGQVRVAIHRAGMNFRDVLKALNMVGLPSDAIPGIDGAGVVTEVGEGVAAFSRGDRVAGLSLDHTTFATSATIDARLLVTVPDRWSLTDAAAFPTAFGTAYLGLVDLADLQPGQRILIHAGTGGVGIAAIQLAAYLGAEVFATASTTKWQTLRNLGLDDAHIANSRTLDFEKAFRAVVGDNGIDVVLNCLAGEFVDASLRLLKPGGRFLEMGKTDIRQPDTVASDHQVHYRAFDFRDTSPGRVHEIFTTLLELFEQDALVPLPTTVWDIRRAPEAFRHFRDARHIGKNILSIPQQADLEGTFLITGGTGTLGAALARHLVSTGQARHLLLTSRHGLDAPGAEELHRDLTDLGATVTIAANDITDRRTLAELLARIPAHHPLTAVIHTAGVLDDAIITALTPRQLDHTMRPKVDGAVNLHDLTLGMPLARFVLYSSMAGQIGGAGQAGYAAGNVFLDALAHHRRAEGLPAQSIAWGLWEEASLMTGHLSDTDMIRLSRFGRRLSTPDGMALFDTAEAFDDALIAAAPLPPTALQETAASGPLPVLFRNLVRCAVRRTAASGQSAVIAPPALDLAGLSVGQRRRLLLDVVCGHAAAVLGYSSPDLVDPHRPFREAGFDSLSSVELRNKINLDVGVRLATTTTYDHPTPAALAAEISRILGEPDEGEEPEAPPAAGGRQ
ncbi:type I polyketide synthase [Umezawaea endophytica]|uniref:Type I polyketide synthase n=1 Tax=Umezawaea endophytica TaxID=1654476 RepID=A0A9X2VLR2_9PSEU|nr:type I polyketide synthase [Umezawaea endophytica]MCS7478759.1 type I polyketide synthase [Umezawaea endophytica]